MFNSDEDIRQNDIENEPESNAAEENREPDAAGTDSPATQEKPEKPKKQPKTVTVGKAALIAALSVLIAVTISVQATFIALYGHYKQKITEAYGRAAEYGNLIEVADIFDSKYIYTVDKTGISDDLARAYVALSGDRFASYHSAEEWESEMAEASGNSVGIGVYVVAMNDGVYVTHVMKNGPAEKAELKKGDVIIGVDGEGIVGMNLSDVVLRIAGESGTDVALTVLRDGAEMNISVTRGTYEAETVLASKVSAGGKTYGYIRITEFLSTELTAKHFISAVDSLLADGCEGLIFDVRDNGGGSLDAVVTMIDYLVPEGPIVHLTDLEGKEKFDTPMSDKHEIDCPMVVLVNGNTASASELFTSALRDYGKVKVVGTNTFGKGCGQQGFSLSSGAVLCVTTFLYSPPTSPNFDKKGIVPDVVIDISEEYKNTNLFLIEPENDVQLLRALEEIQK